MIKLVYHMSMIKRIESGIMGKMLGSHSLSAIKDLADKLHLKGVAFIKHDGSIKILAEGEEDNLHDFIEELGSERIFVMPENFYANWFPADDGLKDFFILTNQQIG